MSNIKQIGDFVEGGNYKWYKAKPSEGAAIYYTNKSLEKCLTDELTSEKALEILENIRILLILSLQLQGFLKRQKDQRKMMAPIMMLYG